MRRILSALIACAVTLVPALGLCGDHVVSPAAVETQLAQANSERHRDTLIVMRALSSPAAASTAAAVGLNLDRLKTGVPALNDRDLRDLAARASMLRTDPVGGHYDYDPAVHDLLVIFLIAAAVVIVLNAAHY